MNCYHHFTIEERTCLRKYYMEGLSFRKIARLLGRNVSSVSREVRRNYTHMYDMYGDSSLALLEYAGLLIIFPLI